MLTSRPMYGKERSNIEVYGILAQHKDVRLSVVIDKEADEKLFHAILRAAARYRRAAALSSFFSVRRVSLLLAKSPKNTAQ